MEGGHSITKGHIISSLKACKIISSGCLYHIVTVQDLDFKIPRIERVSVVSEFTKVFPNDLPPKWEIEFGINSLPDTNPISIPHYRISPSKLKELKAQLKYLLDKGFFKPSIVHGVLQFYL